MVPAHMQTCHLHQDDYVNLKKAEEKNKAKGIN